MWNFIAKFICEICELSTVISSVCLKREASKKLEISKYIKEMTLNVNYLYSVINKIVLFYNQNVTVQKLF